FTIPLDQDEITKRRHIAAHDQRVTVLQIDRRQLTAVKAERLARPCGNARDVAALPRARVEHDATTAGPGGVRETQQTLVEQVARRRRRSVEKAPLVLPLD